MGIDITIRIQAERKSAVVISQRLHSSSKDCELLKDILCCCYFNVWQGLGESLNEGIGLAGSKDKKTFYVYVRVVYFLLPATTVYSIICNWLSYVFYPDSSCIFLLGLILFYLNCLIILRLDLKSISHVKFLINQYDNLNDIFK